MDCIRFSDFILQRRTRQLRRALEDVPIGARAYDLLDMLIAQRGRVVGRDEIMQAVWPSIVVGENNLNVQVANLRRSDSCRLTGTRAAKGWPSGSPHKASKPKPRSCGGAK